jgi:serine/threonine protein kinase
MQPCRLDDPRIARETPSFEEKRDRLDVTNVGNCVSLHGESTGNPGKSPRMNDKRGCPECGTSLPFDAPQGLCPVCLMKAAVLASEVQAPRVAERPRISDPPSSSEFKRMVVEMGIVDTDELNRIADDEFIEVSRLARALVRAGKLTPYQSAAIVQGKARGLMIGDYLVLDRIGQGGMGVVYKARQRRTGRVVALKMLPPSFGRERDVVLRFRREFEVATRLSHPNIVSVIDAREDRGVQFLTMEYIEGHNLNDLVDEVGPLPINLALHCAIQAASGLEAAHAQGIIHRDIKPGNLMLDASGMVRVLDLGLARVVEATTPFGKTSDGSRSRTQIHNLTLSGVYMGTVDFIAPEQADDSRRADHRADIYSLGCTLYFLLTGHPPFVGDSVLKRLLAHQERPAPSLRAARPDVSEAMEIIYLRMMAKKPADRPQSMSEVIDALDACRTSSEDSSEARAGLKRAYAETERRRASALREDRECGLKEIVTDILPNEAAGPQISPRLHPVLRRWHIALTIAAFALLATLAIVYTQLPRSEIVAREPTRLGRSERTTRSTTSDAPSPGVTPAGTPPPLPRLVYEDDFSDIASGWKEMPNGKPLSQGYDNGVS